MKRNIYSMLVFCLLTSCYTYRPVKATLEETEKPIENSKTQTRSHMAAALNKPVLDESEAQIKKEDVKKNFKPAPQKTTRQLTIKEKLEPSRMYKINAGGKRYKIQVDQWESDSLVVNAVNKPEKKMKFHKNQIDESTILEKRFSQPISDILTVVAYAGIAVLVIALAF